jgi:hypothetical protein
MFGRQRACRKDRQVLSKRSGDDFMEVSPIAAMFRRLLGIKRPEMLEKPKKAKDQSMWRQGDVLIRRVEAIPERMRRSPLPHGVLVRGELTGHSHRLENPKSAMLFSGTQSIGELYLDVPAGGTRIVHEEHGPIELPAGLYRAWRQREYSPKAIRIVHD